MMAKRAMAVLLALAAGAFLTADPVVVRGQGQGQGRGGRGGGGGQGRGGGAAAAASDLSIMPIQGFDRTMVYLLAGAGGNIVLQVGDDGVLMVDTGNAQSSDKVFASIRQLTNRPVRWIINTHSHPDSAGGNAGIMRLVGGQRTAQGGGGGGVENPNGAMLVSHQDAANKLMEIEPALPDDAIPKDTFLTDNKQIYFNGEGIELYQAPNSHSEGDVFVFFRKSDVIAAGDLVMTNQYPMFDATEGGTLQGMLTAMNRFVPMMIPRFNQMDGTRLVPSHGRVCDQSDLAELRDMATIVRDRIQHMIDKGMSVDQVKAAKPTLDYDPIYSAGGGQWNGDRFIEAVYAELKSAKGPKPMSGLNFVDGGE